jgi:hypothetical protein
MTLFLSSFILAIAFCAPPGVVTAETVRQGAARGFLPALFVQFGSLVGDTTWALIALTGLAFLVQNNIAKIILSLAGIVLMLKLAWDATVKNWNWQALYPTEAILPTVPFFRWATRSTLSFGPDWAARFSHPYPEDHNPYTSSSSLLAFSGEPYSGVFLWPG